MELLNKKWSIQIIRDLFFGKKHFKEFKEGKPDLSNKVLSNCLKELEKNELIEKKIISTTPNSTEYTLTKKGKSLNKVIYELAIFTLEKCDYEEYKTEKTKNNIKKSFEKTLNIK
ncbi:MAG: helix-turn-helix transcriptional regulator [Methanobrevibacter sp.]|nr:helix-turn-helix transcriptional regulator [Methanobrevibacter sp.]